MIEFIKVFESEYAQIHHYPQIETIGHIWLPKTTQLLLGETYREQIQVFMNYCDEYTPSQLLFDMKEGEFMIDAENRKWLQEVVYPQQKDKGIKRKAYVVNQEKVDILSLNVTLTAEGDPHQFFKFKYFSNREEALTWLAKFKSN